MLSIESEITLVMMLSIITCIISGIFLVVNKKYYIADTINRSAIIGIALAMIFSMYLSSPIVIVLGSITALLAAFLIKFIRLVTYFWVKEASIFISLLFLSIGIMMATNFSFNQATHFDLSVLYLGETAFTYFNRIKIFNIDLGSYALYLSFIVLITNIILSIIFYKEIRIDGVDKLYGLSIKKKQNIADFAFIVMTALSVTLAFQTAGIFMTTAFLIGPASIAIFYTKRIWTSVIFAVFIAIFVSIVGFEIAWSNEISIAGTTTILIGLLFILSLIFSPKMGLLGRYINNIKSQKAIGEYIVMDILSRQDNDYTDKDVNNKISLSLNWKASKVAKIINKLKMDKKIEVVGEKVQVTEAGKILLDIFLKNENYSTIWE